MLKVHNQDMTNLIVEGKQDFEKVGELNPGAGD